MRFRMSGKIWGLAFGAVVSLTAGDSLGAWNRRVSGIMCQPTLPAESARVLYNNNGVGNFSSSSIATVTCTGPFQAPGDISQVFLWVYDNHATQNVSCTLRLLNDQGTTLASTGVSTNTSSSSPLGLNWVPPFGSYHMLSATCSIPVVSGGTSYIISMFYNSP